MSPAPRPRRSGAFDGQSWLLPATAVALGAFALGLLWWSNAEPGAEERGIPKGMRGVPVAALELPAYTEIQLEHLLDPRTGELAAVHLPEDSILETTIVDPASLVGRVLARKKAAARVFSEDDFLPIGTRPGLVAGIPSGKRALRIDASRVSGIVGLQQGDRFDLVATYRGDGATDRAQSVFGAGSLGAAQTTARSHLISENAAVVSALSTRAVPVAGRGEQTVQEMVIALEPEEVPIVTEALELAKRIDCIPRSGLPAEEAGASDAAAREGSGASARRRIASDAAPIIDVIEGERRSLRRAPAPATAPGLPAVATGPRAGSTAGGS